MENFRLEFNVVVAEDQLQNIFIQRLKMHLQAPRLILIKNPIKFPIIRKVLLNLSEIANYFETEFKQMVISCEILQ